MNKNLLNHKPFLSYQQQIEYLELRNLIIPDSNTAMSILKKTGYYILINGYKDSFKNPDTNHFYIGTTFEDIYRLYLFDSDLREILLKYILIFEKSIKSSISYHFTDLYGNGISSYENLKNYDFKTHFHDIQKLFYKMDKKIHRKTVSPQISHYIKTYRDVPLWVLMTDFTMGETAAMYRYLKGHCKAKICNDFHNIQHNELSKMLILLTKFRNICAHGNRLFNYRTQDALPDCTAHKKLHIPKVNNLYQYGKSDLFSAIISLKYLLSDEDFRLFYYSLKKMFKKYCPSETIMKSMGFPQNWMSILRIKVY